MERRISSPTIFLKSLIHTVPGVQTTPSIVNAATCAKCTACHVSGVNSNNMRKIKCFFFVNQSASVHLYTRTNTHTHTSQIENKNINIKPKNKMEEEDKELTSASE